MQPLNPLKGKSCKVLEISLFSSVDRALAFQAEGRGFEPRPPLVFCCYSSVVEHFLGKEEVTSSILVNSSQSKDYVSRNPFFISAERPDREQAERTAAVRRLRRCPMRKMQAGEGRWLPRRQMRRCTLGWAGCRDAKCGDARWGPPAAETPRPMRKSPEGAAASGRRKATKQTIRSPIAAQSANTAPKMDYPSRSFAVNFAV